MTDQVSMQFSLNQTSLNAAIAAELPRLLKDLEFDYVSGREPKGLTASVTVNEQMIRQAVTAYARRTVNASFTHFAIDFKATRGEDGIIANITASNAPIVEDAEEAKPRAASAPSKAEAEKPTPAAEAAATDTVKTAEVVAEAAEAKGVIDTATDTGAEAPFDADSGSTDQAEAPAEEAAVEKAADAATEAPAPTRSKLFAGLARPDNSKQD